MSVQRRNFASLIRLTDAAAVAQLEEWLEAIDEEIATGKVNVEWWAESSRGVKQLDLNLPAERRRDLVLNDLSILAPDDYPRAEVAPIRRTVPFFMSVAVLGVCGWALVRGLEGMTF
jgi:hypothetical protein